MSDGDLIRRGDAIREWVQWQDKRIRYVAYNLGMLDRLRSIPAASPATGAAPERLRREDVEWVVNDIAELGVKIGDQFFFLYKGRSLVYDDGHDDGRPMRWRPVWKREFGEACHPVGLKRESDFDTSGDEWKEIPTLARPAPTAPACRCEDHYRDFDTPCPCCGERTSLSHKHPDLPPSPASAPVGLQGNAGVGALKGSFVTADDGAGEGGQDKVVVRKWDDYTVLKELKDEHNVVVDDHARLTACYEQAMGIVAKQGDEIERLRVALDAANERVEQVEATLAGSERQRIAAVVERDAERGRADKWERGFHEKNEYALKLMREVNETRQQRNEANAARERMERVVSLLRNLREARRKYGYCDPTCHDITASMYAELDALDAARGGGDA